MTHLNKIFVVLASMFVLGTSTVASATYCNPTTPLGGIGGCDGTGVNFKRIENNSAPNVAAQLDLKLSFSSSDNSVLFTFRNTGSIASSITDIYFDDVDGAGALLGSRTVTKYNWWGPSTTTQKAMNVFQGNAVNFAMDTVLEDLPSVNDSMYAFGTDYSADSVSGSFTSTDYNNGVNQSKKSSVEFVTFKGLLKNGKNLNDVITAINQGSFQIGLNVATLNHYCQYDFTTYLSENCVPPPNNVPLPAAAWLFGSALIGFVTISNRRRV